MLNKIFYKNYNSVSDVEVEHDFRSPGSGPGTFAFVRDVTEARVPQRPGAVMASPGLGGWPAFCLCLLS